MADRLVAIVITTSCSSAASITGTQISLEQINGAIRAAESLHGPCWSIPQIDREQQAQPQDGFRPECWCYSFGCWWDDETSAFPATGLHWIRSISRCLYKNVDRCQNLRQCFDPPCWCRKSFHNRMTVHGAAKTRLMIATMTSVDICMVDERPRFRLTKSS